MMKNEHGGNVRAFSEKYNIKEEKIIDFSSNINPYGFHNKIRKNIIKNINKISMYPDIEYKKLKKNISEYYDLPDKNIFPGNGSVSLIYLIVRALKLKKSIIIQPNFMEYELAVKSSGYKTENIIGEEKNNYKVQVKQIIKKIKKGVLVFISNPNNPAGYLYSKKELVTVLNKCERTKSYLFIDEAFLDFYTSSNKVTMKDLVKKNKYLIVLKSFTKNYAVPGLRLGTIFASEKNISKLRDISPPWSVNVLSESVMDSIISLKSFFKKTCALMLKEKIIFFETLNSIPDIKIYDSFSNFLLCKLVSEKNILKLEEYLGKNGIVIRNCSNFTGLSDKYFRIAVRRKKENKILIKYLLKYFKG